MLRVEVAIESGAEAISVTNEELATELDGTVSFTKGCANGQQEGTRWGDLELFSVARRRRNRLNGDVATNQTNAVVLQRLVKGGGLEVDFGQMWTDVERQPHVVKGHRHIVESPQAAHLKQGTARSDLELLGLVQGSFTDVNERYPRGDAQPARNGNFGQTLEHIGEFAKHGVGDEPRPSVGGSQQAVVSEGEQSLSQSDSTYP